MSNMITLSLLLPDILHSNTGAEEDSRGREAQTDWSEEDADCSEDQNIQARRLRSGGRHESVWW